MAALAATVLLTTASAAEKTYQYFRFEPTRISSGNTEMQLAEFTFSLGGNLLNLNNNNGSGIDVVPVAINSGGQDPNGGEGPGKVGDGNLNTKWYTGNPLTAPLNFAFNTPVTIDSYNWASANDSVEYFRSPISWRLYGSADNVSWDLLDSRSNVAISNQNFTYQAGFTVPEELLPAVNVFTVNNTPSEGTAGIVLNGSPVSLQWQTEYTDTVILNPGALPLAESGTANVTPPSNSTVTYSLTGSRTGVSETGEGQVTVRTVPGGTSDFRYVRFKATKLRSGSAFGIIQLGEFGFLSGTTPVTGVSATNPGGDTPGGEGIGNLVDGDGVNNKWLDFNNAPVVFDFGVPAEGDPPKSFTNYFFFTANDAPGRDPVQWTLEGSNDQSTWTLIEKVDFDYPTPETRNISTRSIPLPGAALPPQIASFTGDAVTVIEGQPLVLSWATSGATTVSIEPAPGTVSSSGSATLTPALGTTTYVLTAASAGGIAESTASFTVEVIAQPAITTIDYADFSSSGAELGLLGSAQIVNGVLRLTEDVGGQRGEAWFRTRQSVTGGFEATFGMSLNQDLPDGNVPADGIAFIIQNSPAGSNAATLGEDGLPANALNIKFKSFGFVSTEASQVQVRAGSAVIAQASVFDTPGTELSGVPGFPFTLGTVAGTPPYRIRVVYVAGSPGHLDIYFDDVAVLQNVEVDLDAIGAVDASGTAYVGFAGRTGGNVQNNDITDWKMAYGDYSALPPFGLVKSVVRRNAAGVPTAIDLVWNAEAGVDYKVTTSTILSGTWGTVQEFTGVAGQLGYRIPVTPGTLPRAFYRVEEAALPAP
jgi:Bacterial lectin